MIGVPAAIEYDPSARAATRIVLIGFMGAGKTTLAERWARSGGATLWFDSDRAVLRRLGAASVEAAFSDHGEARFRAVERQVVLERAGSLTRGVEVWSLGGGALQHEDVRSAIAGSCVVWLDAPSDVLWERVVGSDRPLARDRASFCERYDARRASYEVAADVRVDTSGPLEQLGMARLLADQLPPSWFGSGLAIGPGMLDRIEDLSALRSGPVAIVADQVVDRLTDAVLERLARSEIEVVSDARLAMGEFYKQLSTVELVLTEWARAGLHRGTTVLAIGGGTLLDTAGFAASIYQRGLSWVSVPTTLTSQVDAGIGGKTGVNLGAAKNVVGTVHLPQATVIDTDVLATLPEDAIRDGFVEAAKTALLAGPWLLQRASHVAEAESRDRGDRWPALVEGCAGFKDAIVSVDPFDTEGTRAQLNLGHTIAHAVEAATGGAVTHGAAVAIGTHAALHLSVLALDAPPQLVHTWRDMCERLGIVTSSPLTWDALVPYLALDKKRDAGGLGWVLLADVGKPVTQARLPIEAARRVWETHVHRPTAAASRRLNGAEHPRVLVLFGINLGQLGVRDIATYGAQTLPELVGDIEAWAAARGLVAECRQTDSLERFVHSLHEARTRHQAVIVNPGAWTHHERAIHDALEPICVPCVEVHLSDIDARAALEPWRAESVIRPVVDHVVSGRGAKGYRDALRWIASQGLSRA